MTTAFTHKAFIDATAVALSHLDDAQLTFAVAAVTAEAPQASPGWRMAVALAAALDAHDKGEDAEGLDERARIYAVALQNVI